MGQRGKKTQEIRKYIEMKEKREPNLWDRIKLMGCSENNACPFIPVVFCAEIVVIPLF